MTSKPKKNILVFIDWFYPGYRAGGPITSVVNMVSHLEEYYNFLILTTDTDYLETQPYPKIKSNQWLKYGKNSNIYYLTKECKNILTIKKIIKNTSCDIAFVNGIYSFYFSILPLFFLQSKTIISTRGMLSPNAMDIKSNKKKYFIKVAKLLGLYKNKIFHVTSNGEKKNVSTIFNNNQLKVAPNLPVKSKSYWSEKEKQSANLNLVYIGRVAEEKNQLFALEVLQKIEKGTINFTMIGANYSKKYWAKCEAIIKKMPSNIKIKYINSIPPQEVSEKLNEFHILFMPTKGENYGHAIVESLLHGLPVIISNKTPWVNLHDKKVGWDLDLNKSEKFIDTIESILEMEQKEYNILSKNAFNYGKSIVENELVIKQNINLFL